MGCYELIDDNLLVCKSGKILLVLMLRMKLVFLLLMMMIDLIDSLILIVLMKE